MSLRGYCLPKRSATLRSESHRFVSPGVNPPPADSVSDAQVHWDRRALIRSIVNGPRWLATNKNGTYLICISMIVTRYNEGVSTPNGTAQRRVVPIRGSGRPVAAPALECDSPAVWCGLFDSPACGGRDADVVHIGQAFEATEAPHV